MLTVQRAVTHSGYNVTMSNDGLGLIGTAAAITLVVIGALLAFGAISWTVPTTLGVGFILLGAVAEFGGGVAPYLNRAERRGPGTGA